MRSRRPPRALAAGAVAPSLHYGSSSPRSTRPATEPAMHSILPGRLSALVMTTLLGAGALAACDTDDEPAIGDDEIAELEARADRAVAAGIPGISLTVRAGDQTGRAS